MYNIENMDFMDFYFAGHKLSEFGGYVGSSDGGIKSYSVLPQRNYVTDRAIGSDIETIYSSNLQPRTFEVPVVFEELTNGKLREIAQWLNSPKPSQFYWIGDSVYCNVVLDGSDFNASTSSGIDAQIPLKFICYDPFLHNLTQTKHTISPLVSGKENTFTNKGYGDLPPIITIAGSGEIKIEVLGSDKKVLTTTTIKDVTGGVTLNSKTLECTLMSGASHFRNMTGSFPLLPSGSFSIKVTGNSLTNMQLNYTERWL